MIYAYIRVSTDKQSHENQVFEIEEFCKNNNLKINCWVQETISGTKNFEKRKLGILLKKLKKTTSSLAQKFHVLGAT